MNICMKIGLGLNFFTNYRRANKAKFCKDNSKVKHSFFFDNGPFIGGGYRLINILWGDQWFHKNNEITCSLILA